MCFLQTVRPNRFCHLQTQKPIANTHVQNLLIYEKANCLALQSKWTESHEVFKELWKKTLVRRQDGIVQILDLWIALGYCGTGIHANFAPSILDYVNLTLIPLRYNLVSVELLKSIFLEKKWRECSFLFTQCSVAQP
jgi:hypothetical protein